MILVSPTEELNRHSVNNLKVALAQLIPRLSDKQYNLQLMSQAMATASEHQSDIVVFPELFLTGYSIGKNVNVLAESIDGPSLTAIKQLCRTYAIHAIVGFAEKGGDGRYYIASGLVDDRGEILGIYRKAHLFDQEKQYFSPGSEFKVIDTSFGKIGLMICFDVEFPETARALKLLGADVVIIINANMEPYEEYHRLYARCRAMENEMPVIICNRLGVEGTLIFCGESLVIDAQGTVLLNMEKRKEVGTVTLPLKYQLDPKLSYMANRRTDLYSLLSE